MNEASPTTLLSLVWVLLSYLLGSLPIGILLARVKGRDPRTIGSGNIGATNVMRAAGKTMGIITLLGDALKGFLPVWLAMRFGLPEITVAAAGFAAFLGHLFPVYLRFKGGKGVATALGIFLAFNYVAVLIDFVVFAALLWRWRYVSLGSLVCTILMPFILLVLKTPAPTPVAYVVLCAVMVIPIFIKHRANIKRLLAGTENRVGGRSKRSEG
jgi:acyl phosphate:glycerol-3-phosphate acyltransferase